MFGLSEGRSSRSYLWWDAYFSVGWMVGGRKMKRNKKRNEVAGKQCDRWRKGGFQCTCRKYRKYRRYKYKSWEENGLWKQILFDRNTIEESTNTEVVKWENILLSLAGSFHAPHKLLSVDLTVLETTKLLQLKVKVIEATMFNLSKSL